MFDEEIFVPQGVRDRLHQEAVALLPKKLSVDEKGQKAEAISRRFVYAFVLFEHLNARAGGPTSKQSKAALQALKSDADRLVKRLEELDELTAAILMLSKKPRVLDEQVEPSLRVHFEGVWTLTEALTYALRQVKEDPTRRIFPGVLSGVPTHLVMAATYPTANPFVTALVRLATDIRQITGKLPSVSWEPLVEEYSGTFMPLSKLLAEAAYPSRQQKDNSWPGSAARKAYRIVKGGAKRG
jgi:hypothetical protein